MLRALIVLALVTSPLLAAAGSEPLTFAELLRVRTIHDPVLAEDGSWAAWQEVPDRGDGEVVVRATDGGREHRLPLGAAPAISAEGRFVAAVREPSFVERERAEDDDPPKPGLVLLATNDGATTTWERVRASAFTADGTWLVIHHHEAEPDEPAKEEVDESSEPGHEVVAEEDDDQADDDAPEPRLGSELRLVELATGEESVIADVETFAVSGVGARVAWAVAREDGANHVVVRDLAADTQGKEDEDVQLTALARGRYTHLTWAEEAPVLAWVAAVDDDDGEPGDGAVWVWSPDHDQPVEATADALPDGWWVPSANRLAWTRDGARLFLGLKPDSERPESKDDDDDDADPDPTDLDALLEDVTLDVWHVDDPLIKTNARTEWEEHDRDRVYLTVYHVADRRLVALADPWMREVAMTEAPAGTVAFADTPYLRERTWNGWYSDLSWVSLTTGRRVLLAERLAEGHRASVSPDGRRVAWYEAPHWYLWDADSSLVRNLTEHLAVSFADEENDLPSPPDALGLTGWLEDGSALVVADRYDLWALPTDGSEPRNLSRGWGREHRITLSRVDLEPDSAWVPAAGAWLVEGFDRTGRSDGYYELDPADGRLRPLLVDDQRFQIVAQADAADRLLFTRESYRTFPDLWTAPRSLADPVRVSDANPGLVERFAWGTAELVHWDSADGDELDGILIRPEILAAGERCPVVTYYYNRFFSDRLHFFNEPVVNHRPSFPFYASHGYCVFLPDVRFEVGRPGPSAVKALVPAVQKLVDLGIADPDAIGLHGHSWSGYQTAFVVTQTDIFAAAVTGAPVSNMTSAYGGIRLESGLARQFQYETSQSRLGASLWQRRDLYIENSPLFYADRITTPLLIQFGDEDEAVPWSEGVQLYLALRRLDKEAVFLQYRGEPHHLQQEANQLDYSIKMKEFFDHHLKGEPAPEWWTDGVPYRGD